MRRRDFLHRMAAAIAVAPAAIISGEMPAAAESDLIPVFGGHWYFYSRAEGDWNLIGIANWPAPLRHELGSLKAADAR